MPGQMRRIAEFLDILIDETQWEKILEYCYFDWMKRNATKSIPLGGAFWDAGAQVFINRGVNGRWAESLIPEDMAQYEAQATRKLGPECARWLATGERLEDWPTDHHTRLASPDAGPDDPVPLHPKPDATPLWDVA